MASDDSIRKKIEIAQRKQKYKQLIELGSDLSKRMETADILDNFNDILAIVNTCDRIGEEYVSKGRVENTSEYLLDAQVIKMSHDLMGSTVEKLGNVEFSDQEFRDALMNFLTSDTGNENFHKLAEEAAKCCASVRFSNPLLGTFEREERQIPEKEKKERQKRAKNTTEELKRPENIAALKKKEKGAEKISNYHAQILKICQKRSGASVPYYELITDPNDFMQTVDNAFQISFLVRDGLIGVKRIEGETHVYVVENPVRPSQNSQAQPLSETVQCVSSLNPIMWKRNIEAFGVTAPLLVQNLRLNESQTQHTQLESDSDEEETSSDDSD